MRLGNQHVCFSHKKKSRNKQNAQTAYRNLLPNALRQQLIYNSKTQHIHFTLHTPVNKLTHGKRKRGGVNAWIRDEMLAQIAARSVKLLIERGWIGTLWIPSTHPLL